MIDHLLNFADEAAAKQAIPQYVVYDTDDQGKWRTNLCFADISVYVIVDGVRVAFPGWFIIVALSELDPTLRDLPDNACRLITDREAAVAGSPTFMRYVAADMDPAVLSSARVEPTPAGSNYPFGSV